MTQTMVEQSKQLKHERLFTLHAGGGTASRFSTTKEHQNCDVVMLLRDRLEVTAALTG